MERGLGVKETERKREDPLSLPCIVNAPRYGLLLQFANSRRNGNAISNDTITRVLFRGNFGDEDGGWTRATFDKDTMSTVYYPPAESAV